jgi:hypothetical protein
MHDVYAGQSAHGTPNATVSTQYIFPSLSCSLQMRLLLFASRKNVVAIYQDDDAFQYFLIFWSFSKHKSWNTHLSSFGSFSNPMPHPAIGVLAIPRLIGLCSTQKDSSFKRAPFLFLLIVLCSRVSNFESTAKLLPTQRFHQKKYRKGCT